MAGIHLEKPFPLYPARISAARSCTNSSAASDGVRWAIRPRPARRSSRNCGAEHMRTGSPIVYTSADSVFQVAAHEEVIPLWELYKICETAREILRGPYEVGRVIARPFIGSPGNFHAHRQPSRLCRSAAQGNAARPTGRARRVVHSVGKIFDVFLGRGIGESAQNQKQRATAWRRRWKPWRTRTMA